MVHQYLDYCDESFGAKSTQRYLEFSVVDGGAGLVESFTGRLLDSIDLEEEKRITTSCFRPKVTSQPSPNRGAGLDAVWKALRHMSGFIRIKTGRVNLFQVFHDADLLAEPNFADWSDASLTRVAGTAVTIIIPCQILMNHPHNIFAFEHKLTLYVFIAPGSFSVNGFADFVDDASKKYVPKNLWIMRSKGLHTSEITDAVVSSIKERFKCAINWLEYSAEGDFDARNDYAEKFLTLAIEKITAEREPILLAPPGKVFTKPSGKSETMFLQNRRVLIH